MTTNIIRVQDNERIDRGDIEFMGDESLQNIARSLGANFLGNADGIRQWVLRGFDIVSPGAGQVRVNRGVALMAQREKGQVYNGVLVAQGDSQKIVDCSAYGDGTYGVYVRFELNDGEFQNRIFWKPSTSSETSASIPTRRVANWGMRVEPVGTVGAEWMYLGDVTVTAGLVTAVTKKRKFFFEGDEGNSFNTPGIYNVGAAVMSDDPLTTREWGTADDRNADRATYGVKDLQTWVAAVETQLALIGTGNSWYEDIVEPLSNKVSKGGDTISGDLIPSVDNGGRKLGSATRHWDAYLHNIEMQGAPYVHSSVVTTTAQWLMEKSGDATKFWKMIFDAAANTIAYDAGTATDVSWKKAGTAWMTYDASAGTLGLVDGMFIPTVTGTGELGTPTNRWASAEIETITTDAVAAVDLSMTGTFTGNLTPDGNGTRSLGDGTHRWIAYLAGVDASGNVTVGGNIYATGLIDTANKVTTNTIRPHSGNTVTIDDAGGARMVVDGKTLGAAAVIEVKQDYAGADAGGNASTGTVANTSDVAVMAKYKAAGALAGASAPSTTDYPLVITTGAVANGKRGAIKVELDDGAGNVVRGWIRVWGTPQGT